MSVSVRLSYCEVLMAASMFFLQECGDKRAASVGTRNTRKQSFGAQTLEEDTARESGERTGIYCGLYL